jgi:hypothetical protein
LKHNFNGSNINIYMKFRLLFLAKLFFTFSVCASVSKHQIATGIFINVLDCPKGKQPNWACVRQVEDALNDYKRIPTFYECFIPGSVVSRNSEENFAIGDYEGKAVVFLEEYFRLYAADIELPSSQILIGSAPQTFQLTNFREISIRDGEKNRPNSPNFAAFSCSITLGASRQGDLIVGFVFETYKLPNTLTTRSTAQDYKVPVKFIAATVSDKNLNDKYRDILEQSVRHHYDGWRYDQLYEKNSMRDIKIVSKDAAGNPTRIRGTGGFHLYTMSDDSRPLNYGWVDVLLKNGKPYGTIFWDHADEILTYSGTALTENQRQATALNGGENYRQTVREFNRKYGAYRIGNALVPGTYFTYESQARTRQVRDYDDRTTSQGTIVSIPYNRSETYYEQVSVPHNGLKNSSNKTIYIMGIRKFADEFGEVAYEDVSIKVTPQETIQQVYIENSYNDKASKLNSVHYFKTIQ